MVFIRVAEPSSQAGLGASFHCGAVQLTAALVPEHKGHHSAKDSWEGPGDHHGRQPLLRKNDQSGELSHSPLPAALFLSRHSRCFRRGHKARSLLSAVWALSLVLF